MQLGRQLTLQLCRPAMTCIETFNYALVILSSRHPRARESYIPSHPLIATIYNFPFSGLSGEMVSLARPSRFLPHVDNGLIATLGRLQRGECNDTFYFEYHLYNTILFMGNLHQLVSP